MRYIPREHYMIVEQVKTSNTIITPALEENSERAGELFKVVTVGNNVEGAAVGDLVFIVGYIHTVTHEGKKITLVKDTEILMKIGE